MQHDRVVRVESPAGVTSGYVIAPRLVLTSAHGTPEVGAGVSVFALGEAGTRTGVVMWRGTARGRDDAALVEVDDPAWRPREGTAPRWGRVVTYRPGVTCETWGFPRWAQRSGQAADAWQSSGTLNPGSRYTGDRYVLSLDGHPPAPEKPGTSPWEGLSGAALFCGDLLAGVMAVDPAGAQHAHLEAVPAYMLLRDPGFRKIVEDHGGADPVLEPVEAQKLADVEPPIGRSPAGLLRARRQVVTFRGREQLLDDLLTWSQGSGFAGWLLHGPGGQGKTRVAQELARRLAAERWATLWLRGDASAADLDVLADVAVPLLVIVDYAETRTGQVTAALRACLGHSGDVPLRMLLLARTAGDWWDNLQAAREAENLLDGTRCVRLPELERESDGQTAAYRQAVMSFSKALATMPGHDWSGIGDRLSSTRIDPGNPASALTLHMTALADLLDAANPPSGTATGAGSVDDRLLRHERRYWRDSAVACGLRPALSEPTLLDALAVAMLFGAEDRKNADALLRNLPALADQSQDRRDTVRAWIAGLYPPIDARPWGSLQPDRLAERFVGTRLADAPELPDPILTAATPGQVEQMLIVYARAANHPAAGALHAHLTDLCIRHSEVLALPAIDAATQVEDPAPLIAALRHLTHDPGTTVESLTMMANRLPKSSHNLCEVAAELIQRLVTTFRQLAQDRPDAYLHSLAASLNDLSNWLGEIGRYEQALTAIQEAVTIRRELAKKWPDAHLPDLAISLNNLSNRLSNLGKQDQALTAIQDALTIYRELAKAKPDAHLPDLAISLNNLSVGLGKLGEHKKALTTIQEAITVYRKLTKAQPDTHLPDLAISLNNLSAYLGELGQHGRALTAIQEATTIYRELAKAKSDAHLPDLAMSLNNLSVNLGSLGRREKALAAIQEAVTIYRRLAEKRPHTHQPSLAMSLNNLSVRLGEIGRYEQALTAIQEAVTIRRELAKKWPDAHLPDLAISLNNLSADLGSLGHREKALAVIEEAIAIRRELMEKWPDVFQPDLDQSLRVRELLQYLRDGPGQPQDM